MSLECQIAVAVVLDLLVGDPRWLPHPVRFMGNLAILVEAPTRRLITNQKIAGVFVAGVVIILVGLTTWGLMQGAGLAHPALADAVSVYFLYAGLAAKDMVRHSSEVYEALDLGSLGEAKRRVGMICGRDTEQLDEAGVAKAAVESVAENMVDGVTAPLFYAFLAGPVGMMLYKAVNTLDSTFGYKNERFRHFGWASARLDDVANFIPSRITALIVPMAAKILGERSSNAFQIYLRDRGKHPSPNAGQTEAAIAGALGIQLGGLSHYAGEPCDKPRLGEPLDTVQPAHIVRANALFMAASGLFLVLGFAMRFAVTR